jgi:hypothetical protein
LIAEIIPETYDAFGRKVFRPDLRRKGLRPTLLMGRYLSRPLTVKCETIADVRRFLSTCRGVFDKEQFGKDEYWQPPEDFEKTRKGDCEGFALWTWRELLAMGYDARFVAGRHGRFGIGHAWVTFKKNGKSYLVEPQFRFVGETFPRLSTLRYEPKFSVAWDGGKISFYSHAANKNTLNLRLIVPLIPEWILVWGRLLLWRRRRFHAQSGDLLYAR